MVTSVSPTRRHARVRNTRLIGNFPHEPPRLRTFVVASRLRVRQSIGERLVSNVVSDA